MPLSLGAMLAIQGGSALAGALASKYLAPDDSVPDLVSPHAQALDRQRAVAERSRGRLFDKISGDARARGLSSSQETGMKQAAIGQTNEDIGRLDARAAEILGDAINRQRLLEYQRNAQKRASIQQGISEGIQGIGNYFTTQDMLSTLGNPEASASAPIDPSLALDFSTSTGAMSSPMSSSLRRFGLQEQFDPMSGMLSLRPSLSYRPPGV